MGGCVYHLLERISTPGEVHRSVDHGMFATLGLVEEYCRQFTPDDRGIIHWSDTNRYGQWTLGSFCATPIPVVSNMVETQERIACVAKLREYLESAPTEIQNAATGLGIGMHLCGPI